MKPVTAIFLLLSAFTGLGCAEHSVRPGLWELSFDLTYSRTGEPAAAIEKRQVRVLVGDSDDSAVKEIIEISPLERSDTVRPMYADVVSDPVNDAYKVQVMHDTDPDWIWSMHGAVRNPQFIEGHSCLARARYANAVLEGVWTMRWLRDL